MCARARGAQASATGSRAGPPPPAPGLPVSWEPQDPEGGKLLSADVAKMDWIYLD